MSEAVILAVIAVAGTLLGTLLGPWVNAVIQTRTEKRKLAQERIVLLEKVYEDVLSTLSTRLIVYGIHGATQEEESQFILESNRQYARLRLVSTPEITEKFEAIGMTLVQSTWRIREAQALGTVSVGSLSDALKPIAKLDEELSSLMRQHLESFRNRAS
jgi:hypothetical protein